MATILAVVADSADKTYVIQDMVGKGKGVVATRKISMGTRIMCEQPIIPLSILGSLRCPKQQLSLMNQYNALSEEQRQAFDSLCNSLPTNKGNADLSIRPSGIYMTNSLPFGKNDCGIFLHACRINHSCINNADNCWNDTIQRHTIHAIRDIDEGEEITISYLPLFKTRASRQEYLQRSFKFTCACSLCSLPPSQSEELDSKFDEINMLVSILNSSNTHTILTTPRRFLRCCDRQLQLCKSLSPSHGAISIPYYRAKEIFTAHGDLAHGRIANERGSRLCRIACGEDSPVVVGDEKYARNPKGDSAYGHSMKWKSDVDDVPEGLGVDEFEDWLWRRNEIDSDIEDEDDDWEDEEVGDEGDCRNCGT